MDEEDIEKSTLEESIDELPPSKKPVTLKSIEWDSMIQNPIDSERETEEEDETSSSPPPEHSRKSSRAQIITGDPIVHMRKQNSSYYKGPGEPPILGGEKFLDLD